MKSFNFNNQFISIKLNNKQNSDAAIGAIQYARSVIPFDGSFTHPTITDLKTIKNLKEKIEEVRVKRPSFNESLYYFLLSDTNPSIITLKKINKKSKINKIGNCGELSYLVINFLKKYNFLDKSKQYHTAEIVVTRDHTIVIVDRNTNNNMEEIDKEERNCFVIDPLMQKAYDVTFIYDELFEYHYDSENENGPNIYTPIKSNKDCILKSIMEISCFYEFSYNFYILSRFHEKLSIIHQSLNEYFKNNSSKEIETIKILLESYKKEKINIYELSNLGIERKLDKKIKNIINELCMHIADSHFFYDMIINLIPVFPSPYICFERLIILDLFSNLMQHIENSTSASSESLKEKLKSHYLLNQLLIKALPYYQIDTIFPLIKYGADPAITYKKNNTVLHWAILCRQEKIIELIITRMRNDKELRYKLINYKNKKGITPLFYAINGIFSYSIIESLLQLGADPLLTNKYGLTSLQLAEEIKREDQKEIIMLIQSYQISNGQITLDIPDIQTSQNSILPLSRKRKNEESNNDQKLIFSHPCTLFNSSLSLIENDQRSTYEGAENLVDMELNNNDDIYYNIKLNNDEYQDEESYYDCLVKPK